MDYYLLKKTKTNNNKTKIYFEDNNMYKVNINKSLDFIPNFGYPIFNKIKNKLKSGLKPEISSKLGTSNKNVSDTRTSEHIYKLFNSNSKKNGINYRYSKVKHENQDYIKVIFSNGRYIYPIFDSGKLGTTQGGIYIFVENEIEGNNLVKILNSTLVRFIIKATKWSNFETCKEIFNYIQFPKLSEYSDKNIYDFFELDKTEIEYINKMLNN
jgi:hypothetical protein